MTSVCFCLQFGIRLKNLRKGHSTADKRENGAVESNHPNVASSTIKIRSSPEAIVIFRSGFGKVGDIFMHLHSRFTILTKIQNSIVITLKREENPRKAPFCFALRAHINRYDCCKDSQASRVTELTKVPAIRTRMTRSASRSNMIRSNSTYSPDKEEAQKAYHKNMRRDHATEH